MSTTNALNAQPQKTQPSSSDNARNRGLFASFLAQPPSAHKTRKALVVLPSSFSLLHPNAVTVLSVVTEGVCYGHTFYCGAALQVLFKAIVAGNPPQQHKTSYEPVPRHLISDAAKFVQSPPKPVMLATVMLHKAIQYGFFLHLWFRLSGFLILCSHPEVPPEAIYHHRFPYRKRTQTSHLELQRRANLNKILGNGQESERGFLSFKLNQQ